MAQEPIGHSPAHKVPENVEAVQVGVLAAPVHIASRNRLAQFVRVGENRQNVICGRRGRGEPEACRFLCGVSPSPRTLVGGLQSRGARGCEVTRRA